MQSASLVFVGALSLLAAITPSQASTSAAETSRSFYAYGKNIKGLPLIYADGLAYLGSSAPSAAGTATNVTFQATDPSSITGTQLIVTPSDAESISGNVFYISTSTTGLHQAGFTSTSDSAVSTDKFKIWGTQLSWISESGQLEQSWYAVPTSEEGIYSLEWDASHSRSAAGTPVVVKSMPPTRIGEDD